MKRMAAIVALAATVSGIGSTLLAEDKATDKFQIQILEANFVEGIKAKDIDRVMANYQNSPDLVVFDLVPPRQYTGWDAYKKDWQGVLNACKDVPVMVMTDLTIDGDNRYAYGRNIQHMTCTQTNGSKMDATFRVTDAYKKIKGQWLIVHEHISVPVDLETGKPDLNSKP